MEDARDVLRNEVPFSYRKSKDGKALVSWRGKYVMTLVGKDMKKLEAAEASGDAYAVQLYLAKATGHFKHGNER